MVEHDQGTDPALLNCSLRSNGHTTGLEHNTKLPNTLECGQAPEPATATAPPAPHAGEPASAADEEMPADEDVPASEGVTEPDEEKPKGLSACRSLLGWPSSVACC